MKSNRLKTVFLGALTMAILAALAPTVTGKFFTSAVGVGVHPSSLTAWWMPALPAGDNGPTELDAAAITNFDTQVNGASGKWIARDNGQGTNVSIRLVYNPASVTGVTPLKLAVGGRSNDEEIPLRLRTKGNDRQVVLTPDIVNDERFADANTGGTVMAATQVDLVNHVLDNQGCNKIILAVEQALVLTGGDATTAYVQVRTY